MANQQELSQFRGLGKPILSLLTGDGESRVFQLDPHALSTLSNDRWSQLALIEGETNVTNLKVNCDFLWTDATGLQ